MNKNKWVFNRVGHLIYVQTIAAQTKNIKRCLFGGADNIKSVNILNFI